MLCAESVHVVLEAAVERRGGAYRTPLTASKLISSISPRSRLPVVAADTSIVNRVIHY